MFRNRIHHALAFLLLTLGSTMAVEAQQWGLYTLYSTMNSNSVYLVDTNNTVYKTWTFTNAPQGYSCYMMPGQVLCRSVKSTQAGWNGGGLTGRIQKVDWSGTVIWDYTHTSSTYMLHHDHCPLPNGNVLMISYELKTAAEATQAGCSQAITIQSEKVIEVQPTGATTGTIVWEWHLWDHLVQNFDPSKDNYQTSISAHPELMNINYSTTRDWVHMNGIDYNDSLDQIVVSSHNLDEIWVIDHSTTTAEAASHSGGNSGKGGDILYRWGNPAAYSAGSAANQVLKVCHDAHWIPEGSPNAGRLVAFNNDGISSNQSCVDQIDVPWNGTGYDLNPGPAYSPASYTTRTACNGRTSNMGNSEQFPNGNQLICMATLGTIYEINSAGTVLWTRQVSGSVPQAHRYTACYINGGTEPTALVSASADSICPGDSVTLNLTPGNGTTYTYAWSSSPAGFTSTQQNPVVAPTASTSYTVTVTSGGCSTTANLSVTVVPSAAPTITQSNDTLYCSAASSYQWYYNGNPISGATDPYYVPTQSGTYAVVVTDANGCPSEQASITVTIVATQVAIEAGWAFYPNPSRGLLRVQRPEGQSGDYQVWVCDAAGKALLRADNATELDLGRLDAGLYFVTVRVDGHPIATSKIARIH